MNLRQIILFSILFIVAIWFVLDGGIERKLNENKYNFEREVKIEMKKNEYQVAEDFVQEYEIAKRQGDLMQICVEAGFVCAAYLQANDEINYRKWKSIEAEDCKKAGL